MGLRLTASYRRAEDVSVLAVVMTELELSEVQRQIFLAYVMVRSHDSAFEQRPERFGIVVSTSPRGASAPDSVDASFHGTRRTGGKRNVKSVVHILSLT